MNESQQFCSFHVADLFFGIPVREVQEVIRYQAMTQVPRAPREIAGLINLRGQIVTALDMRRRLNLSPLPAGKLPMNVVVRTDDSAVSLLVDDIGDVIEVEQDAFERPPETLNGDVKQIVQGVYKLKNRLLLSVDTARTVNVTAAAA